MSPLRAAGLAVLTAVTVFLTAVYAMDVPQAWALLLALPPTAAVLVTALLVGTFDQDWTPEPDLPAANVCLHASQLTDRLGQAATDPYRFTSRVQPRLRRLALTCLRRRRHRGHRGPARPEGVDLLGADLHTLLTGPGAKLPKPNEFAAMMRRLEEL